MARVFLRAEKIPDDPVRQHLSSLAKARSDARNDIKNFAKYLPPQPLHTPLAIARIDLAAFELVKEFQAIVGRQRRNVRQASIWINVRLHVAAHAR